MTRQIQTDQWLRVPEPAPDEGHMSPRGWASRHNAAVANFHRDRQGFGSNLRASERAILSLAWGIEQYVNSGVDNADPLSGRWLHQMLEAFRGLCNYDLGNLGGGTLDAWSRAVAERWGIDPDTGEWVGGA